MSEGFETQSEQAKKNNRHQPKLTEAVSIEVIRQSLVKNFSDIRDPRVERTKKHQLTDILVIVIFAVIAGTRRSFGLLFSQVVRLPLTRQSCQWLRVEIIIAIPLQASIRFFFLPFPS
jgi:branched-subunit amino acid permease